MDAFAKEDDDEKDVKNAIHDAGLKAGSKLETEFAGTQKKFDAITLLEHGDANDPTFLRKELQRSLYLLASESIGKERVEQKINLHEKLRKESKRKETDLKSQVAQMST